MRSNGFLWGPGVLPDCVGRCGGSVPAVFDEIFHLVDWYQTFARLAGVNTSATGPPGFASPDGIDQWDAFVAVAKGQPSAAGLEYRSYPRNEVVIDLNTVNPGASIVALRLGEHKIIYGAVGSSTIIADIDYGCGDCCPLRRHCPSSPGKGMCDSAVLTVDRDTQMGARPATTTCPMAHPMTHPQAPGGRAPRVPRPPRASTMSSLMSTSR